MTDQNSRTLKESKQRSFPVGATLSAFGFAAVLAFATFPAFASPGHDSDVADHEMDDACINHDEMSAEEHDKGHNEGMKDCESEKVDSADDHSDHQH